MSALPNTGSSVELCFLTHFLQPDGSTVLRMVTDRPLRFGEVWADSRSSDYNVSAVEIVIGKDKKHRGTLYPAVELKMNKENQLELNLYQNPWNLVNIMRR